MPCAQYEGVLVLLTLLGLERAIEKSGIGFVDTRGLDIALSIFLEAIQRFSIGLGWLTQIR